MLFELEAHHPNKMEIRPWEESLGSLMQGYSVYTTFNSPLSERWLQSHIERLAHDVTALGMQWPYAESGLRAFLEQYRPPENEPVIRLTAFADVQGYSDFYGDLSSIPARLLLSTRALPTLPAEPVTLQTVRHTRALPTLKLSAIPEIIRLKLQARRDGFDDALLVNAHGQISEASTANIFFIKNNALWTPEPNRDGCLPGITRQQVLVMAETMGLPVHCQAPISINDVSDFGGAFLTNSVSGIQQVACINHHRFSWPSSANTLLAVLISNLAALIRMEPEV